MSYDTRIDDLLEEILNSDRTAEEICAQCPELLADVRARLERLRTVEAQIDHLFPLAEISGNSVQGISIPVGDVRLPSVQGYEILSVLGRGGMGVVYQAKHLKLNRIVALKMLLAGSYASPQVQMRFMREAEAVAGLQHPNIVQLYEFGEVDGQPYFTMEFVNGGSLAQKLVGASLPVRESALMLATLAQAVFAAHQNGVIHRDLKPANILLADGSTPKISDFGLARRLNEDGGLTQTGFIVGTPSYMAPEQLTGSTTSVGPAADIFALGAILYEMLTGRPPFRGESLSDTQRRLMMEEPVAPSQWNSKVPRDLETICLKCLEKHPHSRYDTADNLAADLARFLRYEPIQARPVSRAERSIRWVRRNPLAATLIVTAVVLVGLIVGGTVHEWTLAAGSRAEKARLTARFESGVELVQQGRYAEARAILGELGDGGNQDLRQRIDRTLVGLELVEDLEAIGVQRAFANFGRNDLQANNDKAAQEYAALFEQMDLGKVYDDPQTVSQRISESEINRELVAALDDWAVCEPDESRRNWLLDVARRAEPNPSDWHHWVRDPATWNDREELSRLAESAAAAEPSVQLLRALADRLSAAGLDSMPFRKEVQQEHADSFLANFSLANALRAKDPTEAIRFYQAALAIRPSAAPASNNLAVALAAAGRNEEAMVQFKEALELEPRSSPLHYNLGRVLLEMQQADEAIAEFQQAIKLAPNFAMSYGGLGEALIQQRRFGDAENALRRCLELLHQTDPERSTMTDLLHRCEQLKSQDK